MTSMTAHQATATRPSSAPAPVARRFANPAAASPSATNRSVRPASTVARKCRAISFASPPVSLARRIPSVVQTKRKDGSAAVQGEAWPDASFRAPPIRSRKSCPTTICPFRSASIRCPAFTASWTSSPDRTESPIASPRPRRLPNPGSPLRVRPVWLRMISRARERWPAARRRAAASRRPTTLTKPGGRAPVIRSSSDCHPWAGRAVSRRNTSSRLAPPCRARSSSSAPSVTILPSLMTMTCEHSRAT